MPFVQKKKDNNSQPNPFDAWFLGPRAEHGKTWLELINNVFNDYVYWRRNYFPEDKIIITGKRRRYHEEWFDRLNDNIDLTLNELKSHFPFYSPRYLGHMLSEQTLPGVLGYFAGMLYNPNNVTNEAAPVTVDLEIEVGKMVAKMVGFDPEIAWAHICSGGTVANIEALWIARAVQFLPFVIKEYCEEEKLDLVVTLPNQTTASLTTLKTKDLIGLQPKESLTLIKRAILLQIEKTKKNLDEVSSQVALFMKASSYNPNKKGIYKVLQKIGLEPVYFVSSTSHYSIEKAVNLLGYGQDSVKLIPVNSQFRMNMDVLKQEVYQLQDNQFIAGVVGVVGTTEEGAVDPIHQIVALREELEQSQNRSFWLHVDAAWGGYVCSLFHGHDIDKKENLTSEDFIKHMQENELASQNFVIPVPHAKTKIVSWEDEDVYSSFLAIKEAESITLDPHKMGYIPYPAGIVAFQNSDVTQVIQQQAKYIFPDKESADEQELQKHSIKDVGPYIIEGSKPGASAVSCWLSHKTIPLDYHGHGALVKTTLLNAKKLIHYFEDHGESFDYYESVLDRENEEYQKSSHVFRFQSLYDPDTNIVCFIILVDDENLDLKSINKLNKKIYDHLTISGKRRGKKTPHGQPYFVSRTTFECDKYPYASMKGIFDTFKKQLKVTQDSYEKEGLFVLRSTIMNPFYLTAEQEGCDYLYGFVKYLHKTTAEILSQNRA